MCGSEPCRHEREFAGTQADTLTSFVKSNAELVKAQSERDAALAALARVELVADWLISTISPELWGDWELASRAASERIRAALEPTQPKGMTP